MTTDDSVTPPTEEGDTPRDPLPAHAGPPTDEGGPTMSLGEAVKVTGVARSTMQRRLHAGQIPGATRTPEGGWSIPLRGLIAAGFMPKASPPDPTPAPDTAALQARVTELEHALATARAEVAFTRKEADLQAQRCTDLRDALDLLSRALPAGPTTPPAPVAVEDHESAPTAPAGPVPTPPRRGALRSRWAAWRAGND